MWLPLHKSPPPCLAFKTEDSEIHRPDPLTELARH